MLVHQVYATIYDNEVKNVHVCDNYELANYLAHATYGETAFAVDCTQFPCQVGDKYLDGRFYQFNPDTGEETIIRRLPTQEEQVELLERKNAELQLTLTKQFEEYLSLQEEVTNTQLALTELFEGLEV